MSARLTSESHKREVFVKDLGAVASSLGGERPFVEPDDLSMTNENTYRRAPDSIPAARWEQHTGL